MGWRPEGTAAIIAVVLTTRNDLEPHRGKSRPRGRHRSLAVVGPSARQGEVALLDQVGDRFRQLAKLRQIHLELLVVLVRLLELVHEAMQPLDASDNLVIQPPD